MKNNKLEGQARTALAIKKAQEAIFGVGVSLVRPDRNCIKPVKKIPGLKIKRVKFVDKFGRVFFKAEAIFS